MKARQRGSEQQRERQAAGLGEGKEEKSAPSLLVEGERRVALQVGGRGAKEGTGSSSIRSAWARIVSDFKPFIFTF